jgi:alkyl hydroperoxide reductase subunit AhpC
VKVLAVSVDPLDKHFGWVKDINETQNCEVNFPIIADDDRNVSTLYDMIHPNASETFTVRSLFVIGPDKKVKLMITYPASLVNFVEVLRLLIHFNLLLVAVLPHRQIEKVKMWCCSAVTQKMHQKFLRD